MELHILIRELNGAQRRGKVIYSAAETVPEGMPRNRCLKMMIDKIFEQFPDEQAPPEP